MLRICALVFVCFHIGWASVTQMDDIDTNLQNNSTLRNAPQRRRLESEFPNFTQMMSNRHRRNANSSAAGQQCPKNKPIIKKAFTRCSSSTNSCVVQCSNNHQFPNGKTSVKLECKAGAWMLEGFEKSDRPACEPACNPPCKNGGVCKTPGKCECPEMFEGPQCEKMKSTCPPMPTSPTSKMDCDGNKCTVSCIGGHALPDGSMEIEMICENDKWMPANKEQSSEPKCESVCEDGRVYKECSPSVEKTCEMMAEVESTTASFECNEGCFCPDGTVEHDGNCIPPQQCPKMPNSESRNLQPPSNGPGMKPKDDKPECMLDGQTFEDGSTVQKECGSCKCEKGKWSCTNDGCSGRCEVLGDPHYKTFDGLRYDFMGKASYYLVRTDAGTDIVAESGDCPPVFSPEVACVRSVTVMDQNDPSQSKIHLQQGGRVLFNDVEAPIYRPTIAELNGPVLINRVGPTDVQLLFTDGMRLTFDGSTYAYIDAPPSLHNRTAGMCGNFDSIAENDMQSPSGEMEMTPESFADKWCVKDEPKNESKPDNTTTPAPTNDNKNMNKTDTPVPHPCTTNKKNVQRARNVCAILKSNLFQECDVDPQPYHDNCMYDMCACQGDRAACICTIFASYGNECSRQLMPVQWRERFPECRR